MQTKFLDALKKALASGDKKRMFKVSRALEKEEAAGYDISDQEDRLLERITNILQANDYQPEEDLEDEEE